MEELLQSETQEKDDFFDDDEDDFTGMKTAVSTCQLVDFQLSPEEKKVIPFVITLFKCTFQMMKKAVEIIATATVDYDLTAELAHKIQSSVDSTGSSVYPPQVTEALHHEAEQLAQYTFQLADLMKQSSTTQELTAKFIDLLISKMKDALSGIK